MVIEPPKSIADQIYEHLKSAILGGSIEPGERLTQEKVAEELQTSRTPVREAFRRLEQEGLVERLPQGGVRVTSIDQESIAHIFGVRQALERYAIELACDRITEAEIARLEGISHQADTLFAKNNVNASEKLKLFFDLNTSFHDTIYEATGNPILIKIIQDMRQLVLRMRATSLRDDSTWRQTWAEHNLLLQHLRAGNKKAAVRCICEHIQKAASYVASTKRNRGAKPETGT